MTTYVLTKGAAAVAELDAVLAARGAAATAELLTEAESDALAGASDSAIDAAVDAALTAAGFDPAADDFFPLGDHPYVIVRALGRISALAADGVARVLSYVALARDPSSPVEAS